MNLDIMFDQVQEITAQTGLVVVLMGYLNQLMTVGIELFLQRCKASGVSGLIIPDLPMDIYESDYKPLFENYDIAMSFLVTPRTSVGRIKEADRLSSGFVYLVSDNSITGGSAEGFSSEQLAYFQRIKALNLNAKTLIGFGIKNHQQFVLTKKYANGAIIGSEFIRKLPTESHKLTKDIERFIRGIVD
jgi:tryptophan synthase alpha chain